MLLKGIYLTVLPIIRMATRMGYGSDQDMFVPQEECDVVGEAGKVNAPIATGTLAPEQWMLNNGTTNAFHFATKSSAQTWSATLIVFNGGSDFGLSFAEELQFNTH
jgi:hypothetical protein